MVIDIARAALIAIDVQADFCPGGALAVPDGDAVVRPINVLAARFAATGGRVIATQDWHPEGHVSFASAHPGAALYDRIALALDADAFPPVRQPDRRTDVPLPAAVEQTLWPDHCVQGSAGAAFHPGFDTAPVSLILRKGFRNSLDSYSAFFENDRRTSTGLDGALKGLGLGTVFLCGLATDYCVLYSALDAARLGYETVIVSDAIRAVGVPEGSGERALQSMRDAGVLFIATEDLL
ncbi:MAG: nicotinamidase [Treponema sp. RIFOXYC1_FULL_61_9]|nr:MAG: nicotinamidase [Treponema sp. RIFOXYC1_FULL_61_9]